MPPAERGRPGVDLHKGLQMYLMWDYAGITQGESRLHFCSACFHPITKNQLKTKGLVNHLVSKTGGAHNTSELK